MPTKNNAETSDRGNKEFQFSAVTRTLAEPGSILARGGVYFLALTLTGAVGWAATFEASRFVKAPAVVRPVGELPVVQSVYGGTVKAFKLRNGAQISVGDTLLVVKSETIMEAQREFDQRRSELEIAKTRLKETIEIDVPALEEETRAKNHRILLIHKLKSALREKRDASLEQISTEMEILTSRISLAETQVTAFERLHDKKVVTETRLREAKQVALELSGELANLSSTSRKARVEFLEEERRLDLQISALREELLVIDQRRSKSVRENRKNLLQAEISYNRALSAIDSMGQGNLQIQSGDEPTGLRKDPTIFGITARVSGTVIESTVASNGQVIQAGKTVARIVPKNAKLVLRVSIKNKDISRLNLKDRIRFKVDAFEYTTHGVLTGFVSRISPSSSNQDKQGSFTANVTLDQDYFVVKGEKRRLLPGMTGLVEIKTGKERLISRFFKPLKKLLEPEEAVQ